MTDNPYSEKLGFDSTHTRVVDAVPPNARVLDIGCSDGYLASALKRKDCFVVGTDVQGDNRLSP